MADSQEVKNKKIRQRLHTTVFNQCFSPDGKYLATCDNFGNIAIFHLPTALSADATEESWRPTFTFKAQNGAIYSLTSTDRLLIAGGTGDIQAWVWNDLTGRDTKPAWNLGIDSAERFGKPETNCLVVSKDQRLFAGCGDNNVHIWDLDTGRHVNKYGMHDDYIHTLHLRSNQDQCISGSEDGTVQIWDTRAPGQAQHILEPYKEEGEASNTAQHGRWIGSVAVDRGDDWMICGGGPASRMWHLRSLEVTAVFPTNHPTYHLMFHEDSVISAGGESNIRHWSVNGEQRSSVPCTPTTVYNVAINDKADNTKVMAIAGNSHKIDICTNFGYRAFSLSVC